MCNVISDKRVISLVLPCYLIKKKKYFITFTRHGRMWRKIGGAQKRQKSFASQNSPQNNCDYTFKGFVDRIFFERNSDNLKKSQIIFLSDVILTGAVFVTQAPTRSPQICCESFMLFTRTTKKYIVIFVTNLSKKWISDFLLIYLI